MKTAIILAAGVGSRLRPLTETMPKCCVPVAGEPLICRIVRQLQSGASDMPIYVATGYLGGVVQEALSACGGTIHFVDNADYATTNNMESCRMALEARTETGPSLIMNADCAYDDAIVDRMLGVEESCIAADVNAYFEENMKVRLVDNVVRDISKAIPKGAGVATSVDLYSFTAKDVARLLEIMRAFKANGDLTQWTEVAIAQLVRERDVTIADTEGKPWVEIDNHDDLKLAASLFSG